MDALRRCLTKSNVLRGRDEKRQFLILGLQNAGKTTLLYRLKLGNSWKDMEHDLKAMREPKLLTKDKDARSDAEPQWVVEDAGYHYEETLLGGFWEVPGTPAMRQMWPSFYRAIKIHGVIFVVDGSDKSDAKEENIELAKRSLHFLMNEDELRNAAFTVIINMRGDDHQRDRSQKSTGEDKKSLDSTDEYLHYRLGLHDLHPSCEWRFKRVTMNILRLADRENDKKWQEIEAHIKKVLNDERGFQMNVA
mmetsp:Transcript_29480/g.67934  ORF Transcript_29480/g.67934 Transcript_29480/m.67934 type:complete len:249 (+) Transcript_29480:64-810(+)